jgi:Ca-activated chloride channel family protein
MIMDEKTVWDYNRGVTGSADMSGMSGMGGMNSTPAMQRPPREKLVPIYPRDGVFGADNPATILHGSWVSAQQRAAAADFVRYGRTVEGQTVVRDSGFRDIAWRPSAAEVGGGLATHEPNVVALPEAGVLAAVQRSFPIVRKRARVLFLVDVSGSMGDRITKTVTKLDAAKQAIADAIRYLGSTDEVGLAAFSNRAHGRLSPGLVNPIAPLQSNRSAFLAGVRSLRPLSQTPLYNAVDTFTAGMLKSYQPNKINAIVLLSDGHNATDQTETRPQLLTRLAAVHMRAPILVFTLAYGSDADTATLNLIAEASGAHYYDATDPSTVNKVLAQDLVTSF